MKKGTYRGADFRLKYGNSGTST